MVGSNQVVLGVDYGVAGMKVGGRRRMLLPPHLGYGFRRVGDIPPNSVSGQLRPVSRGSAEVTGALVCNSGALTHRPSQMLTFEVELLQVGEEAAAEPPSWWDNIRAVFSDWK